jgi:hypothetical protein
MKKSHKETFLLMLLCFFFFPATYYIAVTDVAPMWVLCFFPISVFISGWLGAVMREKEE